MLHGKRHIKQSLLLGFMFFFPLQNAIAHDKPHIIIDSPQNGATLQLGVWVYFHVENMKLMPVYSPPSMPLRNRELQIPEGREPALGHLHVSMDGEHTHWVHASTDPIIIRGLSPGKHSVEIELADTTHAVLDTAKVEFIIEQPPSSQDPSEKIDHKAH